MKIININGEIGWDVEPFQIQRQLNEAAPEDIDIHIASPGGFVFDGIEIFNMIRDYKRDNPNSQIMITIKGLAASMASYLASNPAADLVAAEDNAVLMIHNPWACMCGDYVEMQKTADMLKGLAGILALAYATKSKKPIDEIRTMMNDETWLFGDEIKTAGFVDEIIETDKKNNNSALGRESYMSVSKLKFSSLLEKMKDSEKAKEDILKIAAILKIKNENKPAESGKNKPAEGGEKTEESFMDLITLKKDHPDLYAEIIKAGRDIEKESEKSRLKMLTDLKAKYKDNPVVDKVIDAAVLSGLDKNQTLTDINVALSSGNVQAAIETGAEVPDIVTGADVSGSSETPDGKKTEEVRW